MTKTKFKQIRKEIINKIKSEDKKYVKEILEHYYFHKLASEKERRQIGIKSMYTMHKILKGCNIKFGVDYNEKN